MSDFLSNVVAVVGEAGIITGEAAAPMLQDRRGYYQGRAALVVRPKSTAEVSAVMALCQQARIPVVPQGGNTGLCGGATPQDSGDELVLCLSRMNKFKELDVINQTVTVEAGVVLQDLHDHVSKQELMFPLDLGAKGSCQLGGNLSTNAGGINVLRYGNVRDLVAGLEVVLPDGTVWSALSKLRKDNSGYDLKQLFIGAEGTLGIITAAVLKLLPLPKHRYTAFIAIRDPHAATHILHKIRRACSDSLVSFEYLPGLALRLVKKNPLDRTYEHNILLELVSSEPGSLRQQLEQLIAEDMESGDVLDGTVAQTDAQRDALWHIRESIPLAQRESVKNDVSVPVSDVSTLLEQGVKLVTGIAPDARPCPFGHIGDGNIHFNILAPVGQDPARFRSSVGVELVDAINDLVVSLGGSFSAEHGVGQLRRGELHKYKDPTELELMRRVKAAFDPNNLLNRGKVI